MAKAGVEKVQAAAPATRAAPAYRVRWRVVVFMRFSSGGGGADISEAAR
jgi:hypothetical protein